MKASFQWQTVVTHLEFNYPHKCLFFIGHFYPYHKNRSHFIIGSYYTINYRVLKKNAPLFSMGETQLCKFLSENYIPHVFNIWQLQGVKMIASFFSGPLLKSCNAYLEVEKRCLEVDHSTSTWGDDQCSTVLDFDYFSTSALQGRSW